MPILPRLIASSSPPQKSTILASGVNGILRPSSAGVQRRTMIEKAYVRPDAGWAVGLLIFSRGEYIELAKRFAWVGVNGVVVPG